MKPLAVELFAGSFGWGAGLAPEGWRVIGFDLCHEPHHGPVPSGCELVLQDVATIHGAQLKDARLIVASPPCTQFSYRMMPWRRAKEAPPPVDGVQLFWHCWRIQREASEAAGVYIPLIIENVRGAQSWVGRAKGRYGSFYLWGDIESVGGRLLPSGQVRFGTASVKAIGQEGRKQQGGWDWFGNGLCRKSSNSDERKAETARIARIPVTLAAAMGRLYHPDRVEAAR